MQKPIEFSNNLVHPLTLIGGDAPSAATPKLGSFIVDLFPSDQNILVLK